MAISAEKLNIILSARDKEFTKAMERSQKRVEMFAKKSQKDLSKTGAAFSKLGKAVGPLLAALSAKAVVGAIKGVVESLDDIGKTADRIGITTDALQELRVVAESAGVSQAALDTSIEKLGKGLAEASMGIGTAKVALEQLNLSADDLIGLGLDGAMGKIADAINKVPSPMERTALAMQLFGRSGAPMLNLLREGSDGMETMREEARKLGVVIDEDLIRNAEEAQTQLDLMSRVINAQLSSALIELAPLLVNAATGVASVARAASAFLNLDFSGMTNTDLLDAEGLKKLAQEYSGLESQLAKVTQAQSLYNANLEQYGEGSYEVVKALERQETANTALQEAIKKKQDQEAAAQSAQDAEATLVAQTAELKEQVRLNGMSAEAVERERIRRARSTLEAKIMNDLARAGTEATSEQLMDILDLGQAYQDAATAASKILNPVKSAASGTRKIKTEAVSAREELTNLGEEAVKISPLLQQLGFDAESLDGIMSTVESSMENAFMSMVDGTMSAKDAFKSMASSIIKELFRVLVVQRLVSSISGAIFGGGGGAPTASIRPMMRPRASGGPVQSGQPYVTGEHGRELFVPSQSGRVLSVAQSQNAVRGGGGDGITVVQNNSFGSGVTRAEVNSMLPKMVEATKAAVADSRLRGGSYGGAFS
jgi:hypothetical protein